MTRYEDPVPLQTRVSPLYVGRLAQAGATPRLLGSLAVTGDGRGDAVPEQDRVSPAEPVDDGGTLISEGQPEPRFPRPRLGVRGNAGSFRRGSALDRALIVASGADRDALRYAPGDGPLFILQGFAVLFSGILAALSVAVLAHSLRPGSFGTIGASTLTGLMVAVTARLLMATRPLAQGRVLPRLLQLVPRVAILGLAGYLVSIPLVLAAFSGEVSKEIHSERLEVVQATLQASSRNPALASQSLEIASLEVQIDKLYQTIKAEQSGVHSHPGNGPILTSLNAQLANLNSQLRQSQRIRESLVAAQVRASNELSGSVNRAPGLLERLHALDRLSAQNSGLQHWRWAFSFALVLAFLMPLLAEAFAISSRPLLYDLIRQTQARFALLEAENLATAQAQKARISEEINSQELQTLLTEMDRNRELLQHAVLAAEASAVAEVIHLSQHRNWTESA